MAVECPVDRWYGIEFALTHVLKRREGTIPPEDSISGYAAAKRLGITWGTLRRWMAKGWICYWGNHNLPELGIIYLPRAQYLFSAEEVRVLSLVKLRDL
jgi:hypothetical protein